ncbi:MAG: hypothetical protein JNL11_19525 [Bdellovibrionaceae bacterium]|nr:hypothetical protein [Pseudobdellovibrionaceae bacterium]
MRGQKIILPMVLVSQLLSASLGLASECKNFYSAQVHVVRPSVSEQIAARFRAEPNSFPELLVSEVLRGELAELQNEYLGMIEILSTKGRQNKITWVLETTENTLAELGRVSKLLTVELEKRKHRDEGAITSLSKELQRCSQNITACSANLPQAITEAVQKISKATMLVSQLSERADDVGRILNSPDGLQSIPPELRGSVSMALEQHKQLVAKYINGIDAALTLFRQSEMLLRRLAPDLAAAEYEIARLQAIGADIKDALLLTPKSTPESIQRVAMSYPNFAKLFEQPNVKKTVFGELVEMGIDRYGFDKPFNIYTVYEGDYLLHRILLDMKAIAKANPHLEKSAHANEVKEFILKILRDPILVTGLDQNRFARSDITVTFLKHNPAGGFNYNYLVSGLHLPLLLIKGNGPQLFQENLIWLAETIESVKDEIQKAPRPWKSYLSFHRGAREHIKRLERLARIYKSVSRDEAFIRERAELLDDKESEILGVALGARNKKVEALKILNSLPF